MMGHEIDTKDAGVIHHGCSEQGWLDDAATQTRPNGDHENMSKGWLLMMKIDIWYEKYLEEVDLKVQVSLYEKVNFEGRRSDLLEKMVS